MGQGMIWIDLFILAVCVAVAVIYTRNFVRAEGSWYWRAWSAARDSATLLWSYAVIVATGIISMIAALADLVDPGVESRIRDALPANAVAGFIVLMMLLTIAARMRSLRGP